VNDVSLQELEENSMLCCFPFDMFSSSLISNDFLI
jgi:hypothetical protein